MIARTNPSYNRVEGLIQISSQPTNLQRPPGSPAWMHTCSPVSTYDRTDHKLANPITKSYEQKGTGTQSTRECKPINQQLNELISVIGENKMEIHRIWFDVEPAAGECNAWNLGKTENFQLAKQWVAALRTTGLKWGIYANG